MADPTFADVIRAIVKIREETPDLAWMLDYPQVAKLLIQRASGRIDDQKFQYELYKTKFWKETNDAQRQWLTLNSVDPAKARRQRQEMAARVRDLMGQLGVRVTGDKIRVRGGGVTTGREPLQGANASARIADMALRMGWNDDQVTDYLLSLATFGREGQHMSGGIAVAVNQMRRLDEAYGVQTGERQLFGRAKRMLGGNLDVEAYEEELRKRAIAKYGGNEELSGVLQRGGTLEDWFGDYRRMIAEELEVPEAEISINSPRWQQILNSQGDDGRVRPMTKDEALRHIRTRAEWNDTTKAKEMEAGMATNLLRVFGKTAA